MLLKIFSPAIVKCISTVIIGGGPAGLACGITALQRAPHSPVLIIEKQNRMGGLCITSKVGDFIFEVGCNQPMNGFQQVLQQLGVEHQFLPKANECVCEDGTILKTPFNFRTVLSFLSHPVSSTRFFWRTYNDADTKMLSAITRGLPLKFANRIQASFTYPTLTPDINLRLVRMLIMNSRYSAHIPVGGMAKVTDKMYEKFISLGGEIVLNDEYSGIIKLPNGNKLVSTADGRMYEANKVISSIDALKFYPPDAQPGLAMTTLLFAVKKDLKYPKNVHTIAFLPNNFTRWMQKINHESSFPDEFGFHCYINSLPEQKGCYNITVYILTPRGVDQFTSEEVHKIKKYVKTKMATRLCGFEQTIVEEHLLSPAEYIRRFGLTNKNPTFNPS